MYQIRIVRRNKIRLWIHLLRRKETNWLRINSFIKCSLVFKGISKFLGDTFISPILIRVDLLLLVITWVEHNRHIYKITKMQVVFWEKHRSIEWMIQSQQLGLTIDLNYRMGQRLYKIRLRQAVLKLIFLLNLVKRCIVTYQPLSAVLV